MRTPSLAQRLVAAATVAASLLLGMPVARAAVTQRSVLIKGPDTPAVYYLAQDDKRYVFPNEKTYRTWFSDFSGIISVTAAELASFPIGGNVTYRPGIKMVKIDTDPKTYAVARGGELRWIQTEQLAASLYGSDWNSKIEDVPDAFFVNYRVGAPISSASDYSPSTAAAQNTTIEQDKQIPAGNPPPNPPGNPPEATPIVDADTSASAVVGGSEAVLAKYRFTASLEELKLTKASFHVETATAVTALSLYDGDTRIAGPVSVSGSGDAFFTNIEGFVVPRNGSKDLAVRGTLNIVGPSGTATGSNAKVTLKDTSGPYVFEMRGTATGSGTVITSVPGGDRAGNDKIVRKSVPTVALGTLPSTALVAGEQVAMRVNVAANAAGDVALKTLTVRLQKSGAAVIAPTGTASQTTVRLSGSAENVAGRTTASTGCATPDAVCTLRVIFDDELLIGAGATRTLDVRVNVSGTVASGDSLGATLEGDATVLTGALTAGTDADQVRVAGTDVNVAWSDLSAFPHSAAVGTSSADWASSRYVKVLPTDPQTLVR